MKRGVFKNGPMKGKRYTTSITEYEFIQPVWDLIKAYMIDFEPFIILEQLTIPRSFIIGYNLYPFERKSKNEREFKKVSKYQQLLLNYKTKEEAEKEDENNDELDAYFIQKKDMFIVDFKIDGGEYLPLYIPHHNSWSSLSYAIGELFDYKYKKKIGMRRNKVIELCYKKCRTQFVKYIETFTK